jgi:uncharacterized repeat protein (TIGR01451 family)
MTKIIKMKPLAQACAFVLAASSLVTIGSAVAAPTPAGTTISNQVTVTYKDAAGTSFTGKSNIIDMTIREVRSSTLVSGNGATQGVDITSTEIRSVHTLKNTGNIKETYTLKASNATDDTIDGKMMIYLDKDGSGDLSKAEVDAGAITSLTLASDAMVSVIVVTTLPAAIKAADTLHIQLTATDAANNIAVDVNDVNIIFSDKTPVRVVVTQPEGTGSACHSYEWVKGVPSISWEDAKAKAETLSYNGKSGYLVTITSQVEQDFIRASVYAPDGNQQAWIGLRSTDGVNMSWITGETLDFSNWGPTNGLGGTAGLTAKTHPYTRMISTGTWDLYHAPHAVIEGYLVEYDTACKAPKVTVTLVAAKDIDCNKTHEGELSNLDLTKMASGECVVMWARARNTGTVQATEVIIDALVPSYTSYLPNSARYNGVDKTDAADGDGFVYSESEGRARFYVPALDAGAISDSARYMLKID